MRINFLPKNYFFTVPQCEVELLFYTNVTWIENTMLTNVT